MKKQKNNVIIIVVLAAVIAVLLWMKGCGEDGEYTQSSDTVTVTTIKIIPGDSIPYPVEVKIPVIKWKDSIVEVPADIDTAEILKAYFSRNFYSDTISDDSSITVIINDTVTQNQIVNRIVYFQNHRQKKIITNTTTIVTVKKFSWNKVFIGGDVGMINTEPSFQIGLMAQNKKDDLIGLSYDPFNQGVFVKYYGKIHFRWLKRKGKTGN